MDQNIYGFRDDQRRWLRDGESNSKGGSGEGTGPEKKAQERGIYHAEKMAQEWGSKMASERGMDQRRWLRDREWT